ncbi:MAG: glycosyltransferase family 39 protein [Fuerstiella sp.]
MDNNDRQGITGVAFRHFAWVLLLTHTSLLIVVTWSYAPLWDETLRIRAGLDHWEYGDFSRNIGNPPLNDLVAAAPIILLANSANRDDFRQASWNPEDLIYFIRVGRLALIPFSVLGGWVTFLWARDLFGRAAGLFVLVLWCFDPMILAHGALITGDMAATSVGVAAMYAFRSWLNAPRMSAAVAGGFLVGIALLVKYVWVVLPLLCFTLCFLQQAFLFRTGCTKVLRQAAAMGVTTLFVVNAGFLFDQSFQQASTFEFRSNALMKLAPWQDENSSNIVGNWIGEIPVPLPRHYVMGVDAIASVVQFTHTRTYIRGRFVDDNVWYYYVYGLLCKIPLGTWALFIIAVYAWLTTSRVARATQESLMLLLPALAVLLLASSATSDKFLRYVLPIFPFLFIWAGRVTVWAHNGRWIRSAVVAGGLVWSVGSSLLIFPYSLSYFNEAVGGSRNGHAHLLGPSYDYGQDFLFLRDWIDAHPEAQPLYVECGNYLKPMVVGIQAADIPKFGPDPGWYALSANVLRGSLWRQSWWHEAKRDEYEYVEQFLNRPSNACAGYSIRIYYLSCQQANAMRAMLGIDAIECDKVDSAESSRLR